MEHPNDPRIEIWNGIALIADDTHFTKWVKEHGGLITDPHHVAIAAKYIRKGDVVIDGGANIGTFTKAFSDIVGETGIVLVFEPNEIALNCLRYNIDNFGNKNVVDYGFGLSKKHGFGLVVDNDKNHGTAYIEKAENTLLENVVTLTYVDVLLSTLERCDFIKLDIEGFELAALQGATETIKRFQPVFDIEINDATLARMGLSPNDVYQFMHDLGYTIAERIGQAPQVDVIFLPPNYQPRA